MHNKSRLSSDAIQVFPPVSQAGQLAGRWSFEKMFIGLTRRLIFFVKGIFVSYDSLFQSRMFRDEQFQLLNVNRRRVYTRGKFLISQMLFPPLRSRCFSPLKKASSRILYCSNFTKWSLLNFNVLTRKLSCLKELFLNENSDESSKRPTGCHYVEK